MEKVAETLEVVGVKVIVEIEEDVNVTGPASCAVTPILAGESSATLAKNLKTYVLPQQRIRNSISLDLDPSISSLMDGVSR